VVPLTSEYRIDRYRFVFLAAAEYLRGFWWFVLPVPLFGLIAVIFGQGFLQGIGFMALLWPLTIPSRSFLATSRGSRLFVQGATALLDDDRIYFRAAEGKGVMVPRTSLRDVADRGSFFIVRTRRLGILPIPKAALLGPEAEQALLEAPKSPDESASSAR